MASNESGSGASTSGGIRVKHYYPVGPAVEVASTGWGLGSWGGVEQGQFTSTLSSGINASVTSLTMASSTSFPSSGTVQIGSELITYTGNSGGTLSGLTRGAKGTTAAIHSSRCNGYRCIKLFCMERCSIRRHCNSTRIMVIR